MRSAPAAFLAALLLLASMSFGAQPDPAPPPAEEVVHGTVQIASDLAKPEVVPQLTEAIGTIRSPQEKPREGLEGEEVVLQGKAARPSACLNPISAPVAKQIRLESVEIELALYLIERENLAEAEKVLGRFIVEFPGGKRLREAWFWLGHVLSRRGAAAEARDAFAKSVSLAPAEMADDLLVYGLYAEGSLSLGTALPERAAKAFDRAIPLATEPLLLSESRYRRGLALLALGRARQALDDFSSILASPVGPQSEGALFWLAESWYATRTWDQAAVRYRQYIESHPSGVRLEEARMGLAWCYWKMEAWREAAAAFGELLHRHPGSPHRDQAEFYLARATEQSGDPEEAARIYRDLATAHPRSPLADDALLSLALLVRKARPVEAEGALARLARDYPDSPNRAAAELLLGGFAVTGERFLEALDHYALAAQLDPAGDTASQARFRAAWVQSLLGRWEEAAAGLASLDADFPRLPWRREVLYWRGKAALATGATARAVAIFGELAAAEGARRQEAVFGLGEAAVQAGDWAEAERRFAEAAEGARGDLAADALGNLGLALLKRGRHLDGRRALERAAAATADPDRREWIAYYLTMAHTDAGDFDGAWKAALAYQKAFPDGKRRYEVMMAAGRALANKGLYADALGEFRRVSRESSDRELVLEARALGAKSLVAMGQHAQAEEELLALGRDSRSGRWGREAARDLIDLAIKTGDEAAYASRVDDYAASFPDDPESPRILLRAAQEALRRGDLALVLSRGRQVIDRYGTGPWANEARLVRAEAFVRMEFFAAAADDLLKVDPKEVVARGADLAYLKGAAFAGMARAAMADGRPKDAESAFAEAERSFRASATRYREDPRLPQALDDEAATAALLRRWDEARNALTDLMALRGSAAARWGLALRMAEVEQGAGNAGKAEELIRGALAGGDPVTVSAAAYRLGMLLASQGKRKEAALEHVRGYLAAKQGPKAAENLWEAAVLHAGLGNASEARRLWQILASSGMDSPLVAQAGERLAAETGTQGGR